MKAGAVKAMGMALDAAAAPPDQFANIRNHAVIRVLPSAPQNTRIFGLP